MKLLNGKYLLETDDVLNNSEFDQTDLDDLFGEQVEYFLKSLSQKTYRVMYNAYKGVYPERQRIYIDWYIQNQSKQDEIRDAEIEYLRGAIYSGMDMRIYVNDKKAHSEEVISILKESGLWFASFVNYCDDDVVMEDEEEEVPTV